MSIQKENRQSTKSTGVINSSNLDYIPLRTLALYVHLVLWLTVTLNWTELLSLIALFTSVFFLLLEVYTLLLKVVSFVKKKESLREKFCVCEYL